MITMLLGSLWHGAAWTFVIWGALHGTALLIHREWIRLTEGLKWAARAMSWLAWPITIYAVCVAWIFFRAQNLAIAGTILKQFALFHGGGDEHFHRWFLLVIGALVLSIGSILAGGLENFGENGLPQSLQRLTVALLRSSFYLFRRTTRPSYIFSSEPVARNQSK